MTGPNEILKKYWNYDSFNDLQEEIIQEVLSNHDCIALLPTGGGKSICYQVPALIKQGICLVVSPLIALINDQVNDLNNRGIKAIALTSQLNFSETITAFDNLKFGNYKFLYLSPEKLQNEIIQEKIKELNISLIAIDEAHCISEWGHDFRPSYLKLKILKLLAPNAPILALTATATKTVLNDIKNQLELDFVKIFKKSFKRKSLQYEVQFIEDLNRKLLFLIKQNNQNPAIIYVSSRRNTKEISEFLTKNGIKNSYYHGGLKFEEKAIAYENWMTEKTPIIIATTAFGMGINKKNVRLIIHLSIPFSLENYIQESGRAARDGNLAKAIILTNESQIELAKQSFYLNTPDKKFVKLIYQNLNRFYKISKGELPLGTFKFSIQEFCATYQLPIIKTFNAIQLLVNENIISLNANFKSLSTIKFLVSPQALNNYIIQKPSKGLLIKTLLRSYGGIFDFETKINENTLSEKLNNTKKEIIQNLKELSIKSRYE
ncbi:MAG: RecQ family ATP-dependent DNA helicase, partial [Lutibacter sp.]